LAPEGATLLVVSRETGKPADQVLVDANSGLAINDEDYMFAPGPAATDVMRSRLIQINQPGRA
jgi:hypothetical protein